MIRSKFLKEKNTEYSDWFGSGDIIKDFLKAEKAAGSMALDIIRNDFMILIVFRDCYVVTGYDSNEYQHFYTFKKI